MLLSANRIGAQVTELPKDDLKVARLERQRLAAEDGDPRWQGPESE